MTMRRFLLVANTLALLCLAATMIAMIGFGGMPLLVGAAPPQPAAVTTAESRIAVFNMAMIMKEYKKAQYAVFKIGKERRELSAELIPMRENYTKLEQKIQIAQNAAKKEELKEQLIELAREIQDTERKIDKHLNEKSSAVISELYDDIKAEVDKIAEVKGYDIVFAYPDATSPEELKSNYVKELKLKPPAAHPFFVSKKIDLTGEIIKELNINNPASPVPDGAIVPLLPMTGK
jgi:Skp family chaperone for outer membrane proteins